jgi:hypothetical protein
MNYKLDHITYTNVFGFHSSVFQFMRNVTVKWYTFHVYTLNIGCMIFTALKTLQVQVEAIS